MLGKHGIVPERQTDGGGSTRQSKALLEMGKRNSVRGLVKQVGETAIAQLSIFFVSFVFLRAASTVCPGSTIVSHFHAATLIKCVHCCRVETIIVALVVPPSMTRRAFSITKQAILVPEGVTPHHDSPHRPA